MYGSESLSIKLRTSVLPRFLPIRVGKAYPKATKAYIYTSNSILLLVLNWPSMGARILCNKLSFLIRSSLDQSDSIKSQVFNSLAASDVMSMSIVKQCKLQDEKLGSDFTKF